MGLLALSPLLVFILIFLIGSLIAGDFYKIPITVAFMASSIYAVVISGKFPLQRRIDIFSKGASTDKMMLMVWIFILAGAFANSAKAMGSIDATTNLTLNLMPGNMLLPGLFLAACFISLSIGTSVGTIVALAPIAAGIANTIDISVPVTVAAIVGGAFFGDNLSFISDTTIVATSTQGCRLSDKFRANIYLALPAALIILILYCFIGNDIESTKQINDIEFIKIIPYLTVLITAILGMNVMAVLTLGIILTGGIGMMMGSFDMFGWMQTLGDGILGMGELIIITMMAGGLLELIKTNGGIDYILEKLTKRINNKKKAELSIAAIVSLTNICTANNTVAIITVGDIAKLIGDKFGVDKRKCASILDTMSCCTQGLLPYGAQVLMAAGIAAINPVTIIPHLYYPICLGIVTIAAILFRYPRKFS